MKTKIRFAIFVTLIVLLALPVGVFAAKPAMFDVNVRNRTGEALQFNYRGADGILHWAMIPAGVTVLTMDEDLYTYWADPVCGHIAGRLNLDATNKTLWIDCSVKKPVVWLERSSVTCLLGLWKNYQINGGTFYSWAEYGDYWIAQAWDNYQEVVRTPQELILVLDEHTPGRFLLGCY
jgi:hypothetical protein